MHHLMFPWKLQQQATKRTGTSPWIKLWRSLDSSAVWNIGHNVNTQIYKISKGLVSEKVSYYIFKEGHQDLTAVRGIMVLSLHLEALPFANGTINFLNNASLVSITLMHVNELVIGTVITFRTFLRLYTVFWLDRDVVPGKRDGISETGRTMHSGMV